MHEFDAVCWKFVWSLTAREMNFSLDAVSGPCKVDGVHSEGQNWDKVPHWNPAQLPHKSKCHFPLKAVARIMWSS